MRKTGAFISAAAILLAFLSCSRGRTCPEKAEGPCRVAMKVCAGLDAVSRTSIGPDAVSVNWEPSDRIYLWAEPEYNARELDCQEFGIYGMSGNFAYFSTTLVSAMPEGVYDYYCCCPRPDAENLGTVTFTLPTSQDGSGQGIMISEPVQGGPLKTLDEYEESGALSIKMRQMAHLLQLYLVDSGQLLAGERLRRVTLTFPSPVAGQYSASLAAPSGGLTRVSASSVLTVELQDGLSVSDGGARNYAFAAIAPTVWKTDDVISVKLYSDTKVAVGKDIKLNGRDMRAGHATPVRLEPSYIKPYCHFTFSLDSNPTGEELSSITLIAPDGCKWGDKGTNVFTYAPGGIIPVGSTFEIGYEEEDWFRALGGKTVTVNFDSEHVTTTASFTMPDLSATCTHSQGLDAPWILFENFDNVPSFSSNDEYATSKLGSYSPHTFLDGWSAARAGAEAGKCIRIACRRETSADYDARADSAPLNCKFKKATDINVAFSFGSNNRYGGLAIITDGNVGQNCYLGYITTTKNYESGDGDGIFDRTLNTFYTKEYNGSWDNTPNETDYTIKNIPAGASPVRITWHTEIEHQAGTTNTTAWLYIDNVVVTIAN